LFDCWSGLQVTVYDCFCQTHQICSIDLSQPVSSWKYNFLGSAQQMEMMFHPVRDFATAIYHG